VNDGTEDAASEADEWIPPARPFMALRVEMYFHSGKGWPLLVRSGSPGDSDWRFPATALRFGDDLLSAVRRVAGGLGVEARHHVAPLTIACRAATSAPGEIVFVMYGGQLPTRGLSPKAAEYRWWAVRPWDHWSAVLGAERIRPLSLAEQARKSGQVRYLTSEPYAVPAGELLDTASNPSPSIQEATMQVMPELHGRRPGNGARPGGDA
jgi:hypothetical protein